MIYCYRFRNRVFLVQAGFDPDKASFKPGGVLLAYALEHAIGEGNAAFDFLRGEHRYKDQLASASRETGFIVVFRRSVGAYAFWMRRVFLPAMRKRIRSSAQWKNPARADASGGGFPVVPYPTNRKLTK
jgi:CelD/BcsL family acetyltransferase involved in cellulose biosynthesis